MKKGGLAPPSPMINSTICVPISSLLALKKGFAHSQKLANYYGSKVMLKISSTTFFKKMFFFFRKIYFFRTGTEGNF